MPKRRGLRGTQRRRPRGEQSCNSQQQQQQGQEEELVVVVVVGVLGLL
jgi:hypothetical protein